MIHYSERVPFLYEVGDVQEAFKATKLEPYIENFEETEYPEELKGTQYTWGITQDVKYPVNIPEDKCDISVIEIATKTNYDLGIGTGKYATVYFEEENCEDGWPNGFFADSWEALEVFCTDFGLDTSKIEEYSKIWVSC